MCYLCDQPNDLFDRACCEGVKAWCESDALIAGPDARDAVRYRFIREQCVKAISPHMDGTFHFMFNNRPINSRARTFDDAVDAAMAESQAIRTAAGVGVRELNKDVILDSSQILREEMKGLLEGPESFTINEINLAIDQLASVPALDMTVRRRHKTCGLCNGDGFLIRAGQRRQTCDECDGQGIVEVAT